MRIKVESLVSSYESHVDAVKQWRLKWFGEITNLLFRTPLLESASDRGNGNVGLTV